MEIVKVRKETLDDLVYAIRLLAEMVGTNPMPGNMKQAEEECIKIEYVGKLVMQAKADVEEINQ